MKNSYDLTQAPLSFKTMMCDMQSTKRVNLIPAQLQLVRSSIPGVGLLGYIAIRLPRPNK